MAEANARRRIRLLPAIVCVAGLLFAVRIVSVMDVVAAETAEPKKEKEAKPAVDPAAAKSDANTKPSGPEKKPDGPRGKPDASQTFDPAAVSEAELAILQRLAARRDELDRRARDLDARDALLKAAEQRIDAKIVEIRKIEASVNALLRKHDDEQEAKLKSLVKIYETMKPKEAARIFDQLDMPVLLDVIERMKEMKVAPVIANLDPERAKAITAALATRRHLPNVSSN
jgi:flagellar motility protein MotE (MotC chaperone)